MLTFIKAQGSSLLATLTDFIITIVLKELFGIWYAVANIAGLIAGGVVNFIINRDWVFNGPEQQLRIQVFRYFLVWCGNLLLNAAGVYVLTQYAGLQYVFSKILVALVVGWSYNYILQKKFVFKQAGYVS